MAAVDFAAKVLRAVKPRQKDWTNRAAVKRLRVRRAECLRHADCNVTAAARCRLYAALAEH